MNEQQYKDYCLWMAAAQANSQEQMSCAYSQAANASQNVPDWMMTAASYMQNMTIPKVIEDRIWNEDVW